MNRRLYRCSHDRRIAGVAAGVAEYLAIDVTIVRVLWVVSFFFGGLGLLLYFVMALVMPLEPDASVPAMTGDKTTAEGQPGAARSDLAYHRHATTGGSGASGLGWGWTILGGLLVLCGSAALIDVLLPGLQGRVVWPLFALLAGVLLIAFAFRRRPSQL